MRGTKTKSSEFYRSRLWPTVVIAVLGMASFAASAPAQQKGQKTFATPEAAAQALLKAAQDNDEKALLEIFGPDAKQIVSSGDADEDARSREHFVKRYEQMSRLVKEPDGTVSLVIGAQNWPYPIPLRNKDNVWFFDTQAGKYEILYRRIGYNEVSAIHICDALVGAQKEYFTQQNSAYAQKIFSDEGKKDGLYWKVSEGQPESPIGPLIAWAVAEEYAKNRGTSAVPYRGYFFDGKMTQGFAFVAYPAEYRSSGVMTFIVGADGVIYERDLGKKTDTVAKAMKEFNPDSHWHKVEDQTPPATSTAGTTPTK
jgi:hypothetical protein